MTNSQVPQPVFMIEMSHQVRHIIMKRSYFLRSTRARTLSCREQIAGKSWLEVSLAEKPKAAVLPWDQAHRLAEKFKTELKVDVFVEPAREGGRHHKLTAIDTASPFASEEQHGASAYKGSAFGFDSTAGTFGRTIRMSGPGFGSQFGMAGLGTSSMMSTGMPGVHTPDSLPVHVKEALSFGEKPGEVVLTALRTLPAFIDLPEATKNMYEVEAVQVLHEITAEPAASEPETNLAALLQRPNVSTHLRRFLLNALPVAA